MLSTSTGKGPSVGNKFTLSEMKPPLMIKQERAISAVSFSSKDVQEDLARVVSAQQDVDAFARTLDVKRLSWHPIFMQCYS